MAKSDPIAHTYIQAETNVAVMATKFLASARSTPIRASDDTKISFVARAHATTPNATSRSHPNK